MADHDEATAGTVAGEAGPGGWAPRWVVLLGVLLALAGGLFVASVATALTPEGDDCPGGSAGYHCANYDDAVLTVEPSTDLVDRQVVTVRGENFDPRGGTFGIAQCDSSLVEQFRVDGCSIAGSAVGIVGDDGSFEVQMVVRRLITTPEGGEIDCAVPDACEIGGGTYQGFYEPIEGARVPLHFDPEVPPVPPLEVEVDIDEVTASRVTGTVRCNRAAEWTWADAELRQERGRLTATAYGYDEIREGCDVQPRAFSIVMRPSRVRLTGGPAELRVWVNAYDGFESAGTVALESVRIGGGPPVPPISESIDGDFTAVEVLGSAGDTIDVALECGRPGEYADVSVSVRQFAGREEVQAYGWALVDDCDGRVEVAVPLTDANGVLVGGPAQVEVYATVHNHDPADYFHDTAQAIDVVRRSGRTGAPPWSDPVPVPGSRITIDSVTGGSIGGTIDCEGGPVLIDLSGSAVQRRGRTTSYGYGYVFIDDCDGEQEYVIDLWDGEILNGGQAAVFVSAYAYHLVEYEPGYYYYEHVWDDRQEAEARVRGR